MGILSTEFLWGFYWGGALLCFTLMTLGARITGPRWAVIFAFISLMTFWPLTTFWLVRKSHKDRPKENV